MGHELSMYFRGVSCIYGWVSTGYSETYHYMASYCIAFHPIIHSWWLYVSFGVWKILNVDFLYWWNLSSKCNIYIYILVQSKKLFSYITPVTTSSWSVNETYWVHVVSYSYYACCTLCGADSIPSRSTSRGAVWVRVWSVLELWWAAWLFRGPHLPLSFTYSVIQYSDRISLMLDLPFWFQTCIVF